MSKTAAHRVFGISRSTIDDWLKLREATGKVEAVPYHRGRKPSLDEAALRAFVQAQPDRTLAEMAQAWHEAGGPLLSGQTFSVHLRRLGYTRKKRAFSSLSVKKRRAASGSSRFA